MTEFYASVPEELKQLPNWVGWKLESKSDNKPTKIPYSQKGVLASSTDKETWRLFDDIKSIPPMKNMGAGFVFDGNGIVGIDLDHCLQDGIVDSRFKHIVDELKTYTEISPSGTGLHIFIRCSEKPYNTGRKKEDLEIYSDSRYFTITGDQFPGTPNTIIEYPVELIRSLCDPFLNPKTPTPPIKSTTKNDLSDDDIISIISHSSSADKFDRLYYSGSITDYGNDRSRADMALASVLAFYTRDANQIERIMRSSGLVREKWDTHKTYLGNMTIKKAISDCTGYYEPKDNGDLEHGKAITESLLKSIVKPEPQLHEQLSSVEIKAIKEAIRLCDNLPPIPEITHPLFKKWMDVGSRLMYSHMSYHFGNLLPITSMALGRRVGVLISTKYTYTNFNMMLVGTSTISGKSFSSDTAIQELGIPTVNIPTLLNPTDASVLKRKSCSNPRLVQDLSLNNNMLWYYDEAKEFFDEAGERGWNAPIIGNLCTAYDGSALESARSNKSKKPELEDNKWVCQTPFLSLLFNMTINQLKEASTNKIVGSGFFYRWLWFLETGGEKKKNVTATADDLKDISDIKTELIRVGTLLKKMQPNDICFGVNDIIEQWSMDISQKNFDESYQAATGRSVIHVYKIAMVFSMFDPEFQKLVLGQSKYPIRVELPERWVREAINIVEKYLLPRMMIVVDYSNKIDVTNKQLHVLESLRGFGGVANHSELLKRTKMDKTEFRKAIDTLIESEEIKSVTNGTKKLYHIIV
jgi:hypothetical protein